MRGCASVGYEPSRRYARTAAERSDPLLSWQRPDKAFFAAGACHILAWAFLLRYPTLGFFPVGLRWPGRPVVFHVFATNGTTAFDHDGWTPEVEVISVTLADEAPFDPGRAIERVRLDRDLQRVCTEHNMRSPSDFAFDPWQRAFAYLDGFIRAEGLPLPLVPS